VADLLALCDALKLDQVALVGHSLGAAITMLMAAHYPQRVTRQVMVDRGARVPDDTLQAIAATVSRLGVVYPSLDAFLGLMRQLPVIQWNALWEAYFRYDVETLPDGTVRSRVPKYVVEEELFIPEQAMLEALPPLVQRPTLLLRAELGTLAPDRGFVLAAEEAERLRNVMPDCRLLVVPGVNHYTIIESPVTHQAIFDFLG
jgi:pimeloyl-ACP methyl ester carboxylesterase